VFPFPMQTLASLARQVAGLVPSPKERFAHRKTSAGGSSRDCFGICPHCREFVSIQFSSPEASAPCPRCNRSTSFLESPGDAGT
jgi:hypothetical protein